MYVYSVESYAQFECYSDCSRRGAIWLNPFSTVLFTVCRVFCCVGVWLCKEEGSCQVCNY